MILKRYRWPWVLLVACGSASTLFHHRPRSGPSLGWVVGPDQHVVAVEVFNLPSAELLVDQGAAVFPVRLETGRGTSSAILGTYKATGETLRFTPRFPFDRGRRYIAEFHSGSITLASSHLMPAPSTAPVTVVRVDPSASVVPENLLKFYLHFSAPMKRGEAYTRTRLLDGDGRPLDLPFLELGEELWDRSGTRLTLLLDPGRIKRGLAPREELGPILEQGRSYTVEVQAGWPSAAGAALAEPHRRPFRVGPPDETQPRPQDWAITAPAAGLRNPLLVRSPEPLDAALFSTSLTLLDPGGAEVVGTVELREEATTWQFTPVAAWSAGDHVLVVADDLEDLAGNSVRRPFEVDATRPVMTGAERTSVRRTIAVR